MNYKRIFKAPARVEWSPRESGGDRRDGRYVWNEELELAVNVALASKRPLLVRGPSGSGKSSMAAGVAVAQGWRYYEEVVSSRTEAQHFLWRFDALRRLSDAQAQAKKDVSETAQYVEPGVLWWAFQPESAARRGVGRGVVPAAQDPNRNADAMPDAPAVVLIDEIDKADPDVPNNLLVPIGSREFTVTDAHNAKINAESTPLLIITTNDERELPGAFTRRCVVVTLERPDARRLRQIAETHYGPAHDLLYEAVAAELDEVAKIKHQKKLAPPSTAEYLDAIGACLELRVVPGASREWQLLRSAVFEKPLAHDDSSHP